MRESKSCERVDISVAGRAQYSRATAKQRFECLLVCAKPFRKNRVAKYYKFYIARTSRKPSALPRGYYKGTLDSVERSLIS